MKLRKTLAFACALLGFSAVGLALGGCGGTDRCYSAIDACDDACPTDDAHRGCFAECLRQAGDPCREKDSDEVGR